MFSKHSKKNPSRNLVFTLLLVFFNVFTISAEGKFGMDESANAAFNPMYSYLILLAVFILAIAVYLIFKPKEKHKVQAPPSRNLSRAPGARDPRRRPTQRPR